MSQWSSYVAGNVFHLTNTHNRTQGQGWVYPEGTSYQCFPLNPNLVRRADVSFIRAGRQTLEEIFREGHVPIAPDWAAEVISPNDKVYDVDEKITLFLAAGTRLIWEVNPQARTVKVHRKGAPVVILRESDDITGEDVLPGFRCPVAAFFQPPPLVADNGPKS